MPNPHPAHKFPKSNKGRPPGSGNRTNKLVKDIVADVFNGLQTDPEALKKRSDLKSWAHDHPKDFYQIAAKLIPVQMEHAGQMIINWNEQLTDETEPEAE